MVYCSKWKWVENLRQPMGLLLLHPEGRIMSHEFISPMKKMKEGNISFALHCRHIKACCTKRIFVLLVDVANPNLQKVQRKDH